jgi:hypothetical protein
MNKTKEEILKTRKRFCNQAMLGYYFEDEVLSAMEEYKNQSVSSVKPLTEGQINQAFDKVCKTIHDGMGVINRNEFHTAINDLLSQSEPEGEETNTLT